MDAQRSIQGRALQPGRRGSRRRVQMRTFGNVDERHDRRQADVRALDIGEVLLKVLQQRADAFRSEAQGEREKAEKEADKKVKQIQEELDEEVDRIRNDKEMDQIQQIQELFRAQQRKSEELSNETAKINQDKKI